jgi:hypothetical protein
MNDGVALLLDRMKTHPEEFIGVNGFAYSKWGSLMGAYTEHLEPEDQQALTKGLNALLQQTFTEKVMEELFEPKKSNLQQLREANAKAAAEQMKALRLPLDLGAKTVTLSGAATGYSWDGVTVTKTADTPIAGVTQTL